MEALNFVGSICSILSLLISLFLFNYLIQIKKELTHSDQNTSNKVKVKSTKIGKDFTGRDKLTN